MAAPDRRLIVIQVLNAYAGTPITIALAGGQQIVEAQLFGSGLAVTTRLNEANWSVYRGASMSDGLNRSNRPLTGLFSTGVSPSLPPGNFGLLQMGGEVAKMFADAPGTVQYVAHIEDPVPNGGSPREFHTNFKLVAYDGAPFVVPGLIAGQRPVGVSISHAFGHMKTVLNAGVWSMDAGAALPGPSQVPRGRTRSGLMSNGVRAALLGTSTVIIGGEAAQFWADSRVTVDVSVQVEDTN